jgi:hypothetical protein
MRITWRDDKYAPGCYGAINGLTTYTVRPQNGRYAALFYSEPGGLADRIGGGTFSNRAAAQAVCEAHHLKRAIAMCDRCEGKWLIETETPPEWLEGVCNECNGDTDVERPLTFRKPTINELGSMTPDNSEISLATDD